MLHGHVYMSCAEVDGSSSAVEIVSTKQLNRQNRQSQAWTDAPGHRRPHALCRYPGIVTDVQRKGQTVHTWYYECTLLYDDGESEAGLRLGPEHAWRMRGWESEVRRSAWRCANVARAHTRHRRSTPAVS
jgi:hypothetical protein